MHKVKEIEIGYKRTHSNGKADEIKCRMRLENDPKERQAFNREENTKAREIDSRDRAGNN